MLRQLKSHFESRERNKMEAFSKIIGDAMKADSELYELALWGDEMFAIQDKKNEREHWTEKYINGENEIDETILFDQTEEWDFPEPPDISSRWNCT
jgi:hypothetical protein